MPAQVLIATVGTLGDVLPAIAVGRLMADRGHDVVVFADPTYAGLIRQSGLALDAIGEPGLVRALSADPDYWHPDRCFHVFAKRAVLPAIKPMMRRIGERATGKRTVVVAFSYAFGAVFAAHDAGLALARMFIQPAAFDRDGPFAHRMAAIQAYLGSVRHTLARGPAAQEQEDAIVGLFPDWFCPRPANLPPGATLAGFPLADGTAAQAMPETLQRFLDAGPAPVVVLARGDPARADALRDQVGTACRALGHRHIVLGGADAASSDDDVCSVRFAPFDRLLPRARAIVHHGGIGTIAQTLAAGVPQLALTSNFETPDNAAAMVALGVGTAMAGDAAARSGLHDALATLLTSPGISARCAEMAARMRIDNPFERVAAVLQQRLAQ